MKRVSCCDDNLSYPLKCLVNNMYKKNEFVVSRKIHGTYFLFNITDNYHNNKCRLLELNPIAEFIWNSIGNVNSEYELVELVLKEINEDMDFQTVSNDVKTFIKVLRSYEFIL